MDNTETQTNEGAGSAQLTGDLVVSSMHQTTKFIEGEEGESLSYKTLTRHDDIESEAASISSFLGKPYLLSQIDWVAAGFGFGQELAHFDFTPELIPAWSNKLLGYGLFRGTMCIRIEANAMPFHQGRLLLHYVPATSSMSVPLLASHNFSMVEKTQHPGVELDCRDAYCEMKIPFVRPQNYAPINATGHTEFGYGRFYLDVLSQLDYGVGTTIINVPLNVFIWWEDIEVKAPMFPQSKSGGLKKARVGKGSSEASAMSMGPISSALRLTSKVSSALTVVPAISSYATALSWAADLGAGVAASMGWSKPISDASQMPVANMYHKYGPNFNGPKSSFMLAMDAHNKVNTEPIGLTTEDEMSHAFLNKVETYLMTETWSQEDSGVTIFSLGISPRNCYTETSKAAGSKTITYGSGHPNYYLSHFFQFWRGSVKIKLKFVKTQFHTGRLQVTWTPAPAVAGHPNISTESVYAMREVIDLSATDEAEFVLPYMVDWNYLPTDPEAVSGVFAVDRLSYLIAPDQVSSSIDILVYISYGDDFEFAVPGVFGQEYSTFNPVPFVTNSRELVTSGTIAESKPRTTNLVAASESIGEKFVNLRQLLNRSSPMLGTRTTKQTSYALYPWSNPITTISSSTGAVSYPTNTPGYDAFSLLSLMYAYFKGGVTIDVVGVPVIPSVGYSPPSTLYSTSVSYPYDGVAWATPTADLYDQTVATSGFNPLAPYAASDGNSNVTSVTVPYYARGKMTLVNPTFASGVSSWAANDTEPFVKLTTKYYNTFNPFILRSVADDFQFGYFLNSPPLFLKST